MKILIIIFIVSILFSKDSESLKEQQKNLFNGHKKKMSELKKNYLLKKDRLQKEYDRLLPLYNSLNKDYSSMLDSLDNVIINKINNIETQDDPQMSKFFQIIEKTKNDQSNKLKNRKKYYKNEFNNIDSTTDFLFDIILLYEQNSFNNNELISSLDAEILALNKIKSNAVKTIANYEQGLSSHKLNTCIISLINADRHIYEKEYNEAIKECKKAINNFPNYAIAYEKLGSAYYLNNNFNEALKNWTIALSMEPDNSNLSQFLEDIKKTN